MSRVFADTFYFLALLNRKDEAHEACLRYASSFAGQLITTEWVLTELADGLATSRRRDVFTATRNALIDNENAKIVPLDPTLYEAGIALYAHRPDKAWSLTDCISFVVMQQERLTDSLTGDIHFEQAGFTALFK